MLPDLRALELASSAAPVTAVTFPTSLAELDAMAMPAVVLSLDGRILGLNLAALRIGGRQMDEIIGRYASEFAPGIEYLWDERVTAGRQPDGGTFEIAISTRRSALMLEYIVKVCDFDGQPVVVALITRVQPLP